MSNVPKRYRFDNHLPVAREAAPLPVQPSAGVTETVTTAQHPQVVHIHQAAPDRTLQRVALGSGMGAGAVAASVYFGPLLIAAITSMAISLAVLTFSFTVLVFGVVVITRTLRGGRKTRRR